MHSSPKYWWYVHAGEYVLGLLEPEDNEVLEYIMTHENDIEIMVVQWNNVFQLLSESLSPVEPPAYILPAILNDLPSQVAE